MQATLNLGLAGDHIGKKLATALLNDGNAMWNSLRRRDASREMDYVHFSYWKVARANALAESLNMVVPYNFNEPTGASTLGGCNALAPL